ncbi:MAG TPA: hypothetical protein PK954_06625 [Anaerolineales bacterium]|nr:hypothetical protein [Anaerolineales bacterium]
MPEVWARLHLTAITHAHDRWLAGMVEAAPEHTVHFDQIVFLGQARDPKAVADLEIRREALRCLEHHHRPIRVRVALESARCGMLRERRVEFADVGGERALPVRLDAREVGAGIVEHLGFQAIVIRMHVEEGLAQHALVVRDGHEPAFVLPEPDAAKHAPVEHRVAVHVRPDRPNPVAVAVAGLEECLEEIADRVVVVEAHETAVGEHEILTLDLTGPYAIHSN